MKKTLFRVGVSLLIVGMMVGNAQPLFAAIISNTEIYSAGDNIDGTVGVGTGQFHTDAREFLLPSGLTVKELIQTRTDTFVLASDDQVYAAGGNREGELGVGDTNMRTSPVLFPLPGGVTALSMHTYERDSYDSGDNFYVRASDGNVYATGTNARYMLGNGAAPSVVATSPVVFGLPGGVDALDVLVLEETVHVLGDDGKVYGAGLNSRGELGDTTSTATSTPVEMQLPIGQTAVEFAKLEGFYTQMVTVITADGSVFSSGDNSGGKMGNGTANGVQSTPIEFQLPGGVSADTAIIGDGHLTVLGDDGEVYSAGYNGGAFGNGSAANTSTPVVFQLPGILTAQQVYVSVYQSVIVVRASDNQLYGAGSAYGTLGTGSTNTETTPVKYPLPIGVDATADVEIMSDLMMVRGTDGEVYVSGGNYESQMGNGNASQVLSPIAYDLPSGVVASDVNATTRDYTFTIHAVADGRVFGSGLNADSAALGDGTIANDTTVSEMILPSGVVAKSVHAYRTGYTAATTCVISTLDRLYCAGRNVYGQLGNGGETGFVAGAQKFQMPVGVTGVKAYHVHDKTQFILGSDGNLYGAGVNTTGVLGTGDTASRYTPVRYNLPVGVTAVDAAPLFLSGFGRQILVLGSDGNVYGSGEPGQGVLGNGTNLTTTTPTRYNLPVGVLATKFLKNKGDNVMAGIMGSDGNLYLAGPNFYGQLGNGASGVNASTTPTVFQLPVGVKALKITHSGESVSVLADDGNVYSAGRNNVGQLGDTTLINKSNPVRFELPVGLTAVDVRGNWYELYVLASDGQIYGAGQNEYGQLGDGTNTVRSTPVRFQLPVGVNVESFDNAITAETRNFSVLADDGNMYSTGVNTIYDGLGGNASVFGTAAPSAYESVPFRYPMPVGVTITKVVDSKHSYMRIVIGSDGKLYSSGINVEGTFGNGTFTNSNTPVEFQLPVGLSVVNAWKDGGAVFVLTNTNEVYAAGCNELYRRCAASLGVGATGNVATPAEVQLPSGFALREVTGNYYSTFSFVGGQIFCDANTNTVQDGGESLLDGQTVNLYNAVDGEVSGAAIATYTTATLNEDGSVFYFDGLADGDYIVTMTTAGGTTYSEVTTITGGGGNGWVLGNAEFFGTTSAMGETGFVCGASTVVIPPTPSGPTTPGSSPVPGLAQTGISLFFIAILSIGLVSVSGLIFARAVSRR
jgi:alpha-tubulin suppressor-like RCC1 family protein